MCNVWEKRLASFFRDGWSRFGDRSYRGLLADESTTWCSSPIDWVPWSYGTRSVPTTLSGFGELRHTERAYYFIGFRRVTAYGACLLLYRISESYGTRSGPTTLSDFGELRHTERAYYF